MLYRSAVSAMLGAGLEMAKEGQVELRQAQTFGPIYMRRKRPGQSTPDEV